MKGRALLALAMLASSVRGLFATTCGYPPPCGRVRVNSVLFVGVVVDAGGVSDPKHPAVREVRFQVEEVFAGLSPTPEEVTIATQGQWEKGHSYLIDAARGEDGRLYPRICGSSGEVTDDTTAEFLDYLRRRARGEAKTTLAVRVTDQYKPVPDVDVTITGPEGGLSRRTNADGTATFDPVKPAKYHVTAARKHYRRDPDSPFDEDLDVLSGVCAAAMVALEAESAVSGVVHEANGAPVASLQLELISASVDPEKKPSLNEPFFEARTDEDGQFLFESVSPGRYLLGSNVIGLHTSQVPPTYYPGQRNMGAAIPIDVKLGERVDNLVFVLPDFGHLRDIQVCVIDETGKPLPSVGIGPDWLRGEDEFASLGEKLMTDETGCVKARGYTRVAYSLQAMLLPPGANTRLRSPAQSLLMPEKNWFVELSY
jgi:hypothetical protein